jgi:HEAT repeat protein
MFGRSPVAAWERRYDKGTREERRKVALELMGKARELRAKDVLPFIECLLRDPDEDTGEYAAAALKYVGKPALPAALRLLEDSAAIVRARAAHAIGGMECNRESARPALLAALADGDGLVRGRAASALGRMPKATASTIDALARLAGDPHPEARRAAVWGLGRIGEDEKLQPAVLRHAPLIFAALADENEDVRWCAAESLYLVELSLEQVPFLIDCLRRETHAETAARIGNALSSLFDQTAPESLEALLSRLLPLADDHLELRSAVLALCVRLGPRATSALPVVRASFTGNAAFLALDALRAITGSDAETAPALAQMVDGGGHLGFRAAKLLLERPGHDERVIGMLEHAVIDSPDEAAIFIQEAGPRVAAVAAGLARAIDHWFDENDWDVMWGLACALAAIQSSEPAAVAGLRKALTHDSGLVRGAALEGLAAAGPAARDALADLRKLERAGDAESRRIVRKTIAAIERPTH